MKKCECFDAGAKHTDTGWRCLRCGGLVEYGPDEDISTGNVTKFESQEDAVAFLKENRQ